MISRSNGSDAENAPVRCAIYTRKSTEEGLDQEFNSLDAQREERLHEVARRFSWVRVARVDSEPENHR